jgi:hypothetical protein
VLSWLHGWRALLLFTLGVAVVLKFGLWPGGDGKPRFADAADARYLVPAEATVVGDEWTGCGEFGTSGCFIMYFFLPRQSVESKTVAVKEKASLRGWTLESADEGERGTILEFVRDDVEAEVVLWRDSARRCREHLLRECSTTLDHLSVQPR